MIVVHIIFGFALALITGFIAQHLGASAGMAFWAYVVGGIAGLLASVLWTLLKSETVSETAQKQTSVSS